MIKRDKCIYYLNMIFPKRKKPKDENNYHKFVMKNKINFAFLILLDEIYKKYPYKLIK